MGEGAGDMPHRSGTTAQRVRIGLTGLAFAFLLVLLGSIVSRSGQDANSAAVQNAATNTPKEPLAELGVQPAPEQAPIVPDLQPDPNLKKPMDREIQPTPH
jgi:hypothetical protein